MRNRFLKVMLVGMALDVKFGLAERSISRLQLITRTDISNVLSKPAAQLTWDMRRLWIEHALWTRNYIVSATSGLEDRDKVLARLLRVQQDIGNAVKPYYGEAAGNKLAELLREHILIAGKIVAAAMQGNQADVERYNKDWYSNADNLAKFLSGANPNWSQKNWRIYYMCICSRSQLSLQPG